MGEVFTPENCMVKRLVKSVRNRVNKFTVCRLLYRAFPPAHFTWIDFGEKGPVFLSSRAPLPIRGTTRQMMIVSGMPIRTSLTCAFF